ncbi:PREDICTED: keratin-associated protein 16-1-like [Galeopterus variegatus]|uniref:Keratin-associated protein 16-1-like n=1 Tax=Galeopterus variegatus TaxID=482537 RepID=A0ABM0S6Q2_GALVR|nr:PREDICTED: keratin-associated protein 16-1-like [Galeopterus variegatus]
MNPKRRGSRDNPEVTGASCCKPSCSQSSCCIPVCSLSSCCKPSCSQSSCCVPVCSQSSCCKPCCSYCCKPSCSQSSCCIPVCSQPSCSISMCSQSSCSPLLPWAWAGASAAEGAGHPRVPWQEQPPPASPAARQRCPALRAQPRVSRLQAGRQGSAQATERALPGQCRLSALASSSQPATPCNPGPCLASRGAAGHGSGSTRSATCADESEWVNVDGVMGPTEPLPLRERRDRIVLCVRTEGSHSPFPRASLPPASPRVGAQALPGPSRQCPDLRHVAGAREQRLPRPDATQNALACVTV